MARLTACTTCFRAAWISSRMSDTRRGLGSMARGCPPLSGPITQLLQIPVHLLVQLRNLSLDLFPLCLHCNQVDFLFLLKCIDIAGNIEVEVVLLDLLQAGQIGIL